MKKNNLNRTNRLNTSLNEKTVMKMLKEEALTGNPIPMSTIIEMVKENPLLFTCGMCDDELAYRENGDLFGEAWMLFDNRYTEEYEDICMVPFSVTSSGAVSVDYSNCTPDEKEIALWGNLEECIIENLCNNMGFSFDATMNNENSRLDYDPNEPLYRCPSCGEEETIDWNHETVDDGEVDIATCPKCGREWRVCYSLHFDGNIVEDN